MLLTPRKIKPFTERLRQHREDAGLTQVEVSARLGMTDSAYQAYEAGRCSPPATKLVALSKIFNVTIELLVRGYDDYAGRKKC